MANDLIKPSTMVDEFRIKGSKDIVDAFIESNLKQCEIDVSATGRDANNVYMALGLYLKRHPILRVKVITREDRVFLIRLEGEQDGKSSTPEST